ncbi:DUF4326 domain-containing protein [Nocardia sp. NRRL S-836]|uniref:DUF4326 domain-containing protein n=1 Tax=Nocardia sp. NRRL S-836 TaxID=1519492 RepID=UPI002100ADBE|nr:DUF4326 domain-containing protein [Nocardia sp. NRRL S-836]
MQRKSGTAREQGGRFTGRPLQARPVRRLHRTSLAVGNPFEIGKDGTRDEVITLYEEWVLEQPELMAQLA